MNEITVIDFLIVGVYLLGMLAIGIHFVKRIRNREDFYAADHSLSTPVLLATVCATIIGGSSMMGRAGLGYPSGIECLMTALPYMIGMFLFSAYAGRIYDVGEKYGITSIPSLFEYRFGKSAKVIIAIMIALAMMGTVASQVTATATIIRIMGSGIGVSYEVGALIGKRGRTLDSLQYLASIVQNKNTEKYTRVLINAESYREKREKTLQQFARKVADKCVRSGRNQRLEPMNPYERKVIHSTLQSDPRVTTRSEGSEPSRRVVIEVRK